MNRWLSDSKRNNVILSSIALLVIASMSILITFDQLSDFPSKKHSWANCDRLAITMRYVDNGLKPLPAETYIMNNKYRSETATDSNITAVDLPVYDYLGAVILSIAGVRSIFMLRIMYLMISILGLFYLYRLMMLLSNRNFIISLILPVLTLTCPTFIFYQTGLIPTVSSLSFAIIGIYYYMRGYESGKANYFYISIGVLTVAALARLPFLIPMIAISCVEIWQVIRTKKGDKKLIAMSVGYAIVGAAWIYNDYLRDAYGSMFLSAILPPTSFGDAKEILKQIYENWWDEYFTPAQYITIFMLMLLSVGYMILKRRAISKVNSRFIFLSGVILIGALMYSGLMLRQFPNHDYYFLDTVFLPVMLIIGFLLSLLPKPKPLFGVIGLTLICVYILPSSIEKNNEVQGNIWGATEYTGLDYNRYKESGKLLDSLGVGKQDIVLVYNVYSPNMPFILMNRRGYCVDDIDEEDVIRTLKWNYDYIVLPKGLFQEMPFVYFHVEGSFDKLGENDKLTVYKNTKHDKDTTFIRWKERNIFKQRDEFNDSENGVKIGSNTEYYNLTIAQDWDLRNKCFVNMKPTLKVRSNNDSIRDLFMVIKICNAGREDMFSNNRLDSYLTGKQGEWVDIELNKFYDLKDPKIDKLLIYIHNAGRNELDIKSFYLDVN